MTRTPNPYISAYEQPSRFASLSAAAGHSRYFRSRTADVGSCAASNAREKAQRGTTAAMTSALSDWRNLRRLDVVKPDVF